jgi:hypothetical protein
MGSAASRTRAYCTGTHRYSCVLYCGGTRRYGILSLLLWCMLSQCVVVCIRNRHRDALSVRESGKVPYPTVSTCRAQCGFAVGLVADQC